LSASCGAARPAETKCRACWSRAACRSYSGGTAAGNKAVQMFKALNSMRGSAFLEPEWVAMHPTDYEAIRLLTDTAGQFSAAARSLGSYGNVTLADASNQLTGATDTLWGKPVHVTAGIGGAGTAVIGTREGAQVWSRGGVRVESTNSHASLFTSDIVAIRAERRLALSVYRPAGYVDVRLA
jgi:HK97 family phage major capsid protein